MQDFLNWRTDPLLIDNEPAKPNQWLTANDLLEEDRRDSFITPESQLLLYPIMIRKIDFITGERILQSFPYILLNEEWITIIRKQSLSLAEKTHHYFMKSNYKRSIRDWQKKIINYLEKQGRLPFPLFRLSENWLDYFKNKNCIKFQSARGEDFRLPLYLSEDLAYLSGVIMGDGHLAKYLVNIIDSSREHIENLTQMLISIFKSKIEFFKQPNANAWNANLLGKWVVQFFNFLSGQPIKARKYPALREPLIFQENDLFRTNFWRGLMDADGSYLSNIKFATASTQLLIDFSNFLSSYNIQYRLFTQTVFCGTTHSLTVAGESRKFFTSLIGSNHPQKQKELQILLKRKVLPFVQKSNTLLQQGLWNGQVQIFNPQKLNDNYFDITYISNLNVLNLGEYIQLLRKQHHHKQKELASELGVTPSLLSKYELNKSGIPIHLLLIIFSLYNVSLHSFLFKHSKLFFQINNSICQFDTRPSNELLFLLQGLQSKKGGYFFIIGLKEYSIDEYKTLLSDYFTIAKPKNSRFNNATLYILIQEFCILRNGINNFDSLKEEN